MSASSISFYVPFVSSFWFKPALYFLMLPFDVQRIPNGLLAVKKVLVRTLKLLFWGLLLQG